MPPTTRPGDIGYIGETYVLYKLALMGLKATLLNPNYDYDILIENGTRIEVKTSQKRTHIKKVMRKKLGLIRSYPREIWQFANHQIDYRGMVKVDSFKYALREIKFKQRDRKCDFFICICLGKNFEIEREYILPKEVVGTKRSIVMGEKEQGIGKEEGIYVKYKNKWNLIKNFENKGIGS